MDFGVGLDGLVGSGTTTNCSSGFGSVASSTPETKLKWYGSGLLKQGRPATAEDNWRSSKLSKTDSMPLPQRSGTLLKSDTILFPDGLQQQQQMLSFSCNKPAHSVERSTHSASLPYFHLISPATSKNTGTRMNNITASKTFISFMAYGNRKHDTNLGFPYGNKALYSMG